MQKIECWVSLGSTYSYLTVMRLASAKSEADVEVDWRIFSVRALMQEMKNVPFVGKPAKEAYMWRDIERRAARCGFPVQFPVTYPIPQFDLANRVALIGEQEGWCQNFLWTSYQLWFQKGLTAGDDANLHAAIRSSGQVPERVIELASADETADALSAATVEARSLGIFGSPSFVVDGAELFWGDDRLEDAIEWANFGRLVNPESDNNNSTSTT